MSRDLADLYPPIADQAAQLLDAASESGLDLLVYSTLRSARDQAVLFRAGRSLEDIVRKADELELTYSRPDLAELLIDAGPNYSRKVVTWAGPGQSAHNYGLAMDAVPMRAGKLVWGTQDPADLALWKRYGVLAGGIGLEWAGLWPLRKREYPHVQASGFDWRAMIRGWRFSE
jgi:peptidoglycan L-alanyl-D-glutamate endopeptidase CwlK